MAVLLGTMTSADAAPTDNATSWSNFFSGSDGFVRPYTSDGVPITDHELSSDPSTGGAAATPGSVDLSSGSPTGAPGPFETPLYGYYNGGTPYDANDPSTYEDDFIIFRLRLGGDPSSSSPDPDFVSAHWNILVDVDADGFKEYWIDVDGPYDNGFDGADRVQILYDDSNTQEILDDDAPGVRVNEFTAKDSDTDSRSHTRVVSAADGTGDYFLDVQVPMTAFIDSNGNQVMFPTSPVAFVYSTSTSNTDPLQKDWMQELDPDGGTFSSNDPIVFGDIVTPNGEPVIDQPGVSITQFTLQSGENAAFYAVCDDAFVIVNDPTANSNDAAIEFVTALVKNQANGDDEQLTMLTETSENSGVFTNRGAAHNVVFTEAPSHLGDIDFFISYIATSAATITESWTAVYDNGAKLWAVTGSISGLQTGTATSDVEYTSDNGEARFTIYEINKPNNANTGDQFSFDTLTAEGLQVLDANFGPTPPVDEDDIASAESGDTLSVYYQSPGGSTSSDAIAVVGTAGTSCNDPNAVSAPFVVFTRSTGLITNSYQIASEPAGGDALYVTVFDNAANADSGVSESVTVTIARAGGDTETITLTETGPDTGVFRNTVGLDTQFVDTNGLAAQDDLWEGVDGDVITVTYDNGVYTITDQATLTVPGAGSVRFTNGAGIIDVDSYAQDDYALFRIDDSNYTSCGTAPPFTVDVVSDLGDVEAVSVYEMFSGASAFMNREGGLVTTDGSEIVSATGRDFCHTDGVMVGDVFLIATGPNAGTYAIADVGTDTSCGGSGTLAASQIQLSALSVGAGEGRASLAFSISPLFVQEAIDMSYTTGDGVLEANDLDSLEIRYLDCDDGDLDNANDEKVDTALALFSTTRAIIDSFQTIVDSKQIRVQWTTSSEYRSLGFYVERKTSIGQFERLNHEPVPALIGAPQGGTYSIIDPGARPGRRETYRIIEVEVDGTTHEYGPFSVKPKGTVAASHPHHGGANNLYPRRQAHSDPARIRQQRRRQQAAAARQALREAHSRGRGPWRTMKIVTHETGLHVIGHLLVASLLEIKPREAKRLIERNQLALSRAGEPVATTVWLGDLYFYAPGFESPYTDADVYWLRKAPGYQMEFQNLGTTRPGKPVAESFVDTLHIEEDHVSTVHLAEDPDDDLWSWNYLMTVSGPTSATYPFKAPSAVMSSAATLTVELQGASALAAGDDHLVTVHLNGAPLGSVSWKGLSRVKSFLPVPAGTLIDGTNTLELRTEPVSGVPISVVYIDGFELQYNRRLQAEADQLSATLGQQQQARIQGFTQPDIIALSLLDPLSPSLLGVQVTATQAGYTASIDPGSAPFVVAARASAYEPSAAWVAAPSRLRDNHDHYKYLIITTPDMMGPAVRLANYRNSQGLNAAVVDIDAVFNGFTYGRKDPYAIHDFLEDLQSTKEGAPEFVLLIGKGSFDYKDILGHADSAVPSPLVKTPDGLFSSDSLLADLLGDDGVPEVAIGRLSVDDAPELDRIVTKIISYEATPSGDWSRRALFAADADDEAGEFTLESELTALYAPDHFEVTLAHVEELGVSGAQSTFNTAISDGQAYAQFIGHGAFDRLGNANLLSSPEAKSLANSISDGIPIFLAQTCLAGNYAIPNLDSIGVALVNNPSGGAIASFAPSGLSVSRDATQLGIGFFKAVFQEPGMVLGHALESAKEYAKMKKLPTYMLDQYNLLGDPATRIPQ